jgi:hypothetical protein
MHEISTIATAIVISLISVFSGIGACFICAVLNGSKTPGQQRLIITVGMGAILFSINSIYFMIYHGVRL